MSSATKPAPRTPLQRFFLNLVTGTSEGLLVFGSVALLGFLVAGEAVPALTAAVLGALMAGLNKGLHDASPAGLLREILHDALLGLILISVVFVSGLAELGPVRIHFAAFGLLCLTFSLLSGTIKRELWPEKV